MSAQQTPAPALTARELPWLSGLTRSGRLRELYRTNPGPVHLLHPRTFAETLNHWLEIAREHETPVAIRFGKKANKSPALARECARFAARGHDVGIDVASAEEFTAALAAGNRGTRLIVTGPTHPEPLLRLAADHGASVTVATVGDLHRTARVVVPAPVDVFLRLRVEAHSRFGLTEDEARTLLEKPPGTSGLPDNVRIRGLSFHCGGYTVAERIAAMKTALAAAAVGRASGHPLETISAGGGWPVNHVAAAAGTSPAEIWSRYWTSLSPRHFFTGSVPADAYPYGVDTSGPKALAAFLRHEVGHELRQRGLRLMVEPGRALCSGVGASVFPVLSTQNRPEFGPHVGVTVVDGTSLSLSEQWFSSEFFPDPMLHDDSGVPVPLGDGPPYGAAVAGRTCLDPDLLSRRYVPLPRPPREGDLLIYPDTAGYQMDSNESAFHEIPVPRKYVVDGPLNDPYLKEDV